MEEVGAIPADGSDDLDGHPWIQVDGAAHLLERDAHCRQLLVEAGSIGVGHVESEEARVDTTFAECGQQ